MITDIIENIKEKHNKPILEMTDKIDKYEEEITALKNDLSADSVIIAENEGKLKQWKSDYLALQKSSALDAAALRSKISELQNQIANLTKLNESYTAENEKLKAEQVTLINSRHEKPHNERGAGRKSRITPEIKQLILDLKSQNLTQAEIAKKLTEGTGEHWSRSTIGQVLSNIVLK